MIRACLSASLVTASDKKSEPGFREEAHLGNWFASQIVRFPRSRWCRKRKGRGGLPPGCSGEHAVDDNVDGETKPLVAIAGDELCGVGGDQGEPVGR